jgi:hypothetical protein
LCGCLAAHDIKLHVRLQLKKMIMVLRSLLAPRPKLEVMQQARGEYLTQLPSCAEQHCCVQQQEEVLAKQSNLSASAAQEFAGDNLSATAWIHGISVLCSKAMAWPGQHKRFVRGVGILASFQTCTSPCGLCRTVLLFQLHAAALDSIWASLLLAGRASLQAGLVPTVSIKPYSVCMSGLAGHTRRC